MKLISILPLLWFLARICAVSGSSVPTLDECEAECLDPMTAASSLSDARPTSLAATPDGTRLFVALSGPSQVCLFDTAAGEITQRLDLPAPPSGLALSPDNSRLYVTCAAPESTVCIVNIPDWRITDQIAAGHTAMAPALSPDGKTLYVCNRFNHDVSVIDLAAGRETRRIAVQREPVAAAITPNGQFLIVANHLPARSANHLHSSAVVSVIDLAADCLVKEMPLSLGASLLRGIAISPDGRFAAVAHIRALFWLTTSETRLGRINSNALTVLDLQRFHVLGMVLLDQTCRGAASPWAVAWSPDGKTIAVSHAGTHEMSLIDAPVTADGWNFHSPFLAAYTRFGNRVPDPPKHPVRVRQRVALRGLGPRAIAIAGSQVYVANYFTGDLNRMDLTATRPVVEAFPLVPPTQAASAAELGELLFNDARLCFEGWQSCASCHDNDARSDALNWDLLNDGAGNPKNTKSLVWAHQTGPAMATGIRANAEVAVRAGLHHILFNQASDQAADAMDAYLKSLPIVPSPHLVRGQLSAAALRGQALFNSARTGCAVCHPAPLFTDLATYDVGTATVYKSMWGMSEADARGAKFDTPTLVELWRSAPYLHDGSAVTLRDLLTTQNPNDQHGRTSDLSPEELNDLIEYLLAL